MSEAIEHLSGARIKELLGSLVYVWRRADGEVLYVGQSKFGINRALGRGHHVIGKKAKILDDDVLELHYVSLEDLDKAEAAMIKERCPKYNVIGMYPAVGTSPKQRKAWGWEEQAEQPPRKTERKKCPACLFMFLPTRTNQTYCSDKCRYDYHNALKRECKYLRHTC